MALVRTSDGDAVRTSDGDLVVTFDPAGPFCADAIDLSALLPFSQTYDTRGYGANAPATVCGATSNSAWFKYTAGLTDEVIVVDTIGSDFDTLLAVFGGSCASLIERQCSEDYNICGVNLSPQSAIVAGVRAGTTLYILVSGSGSLKLSARRHDILSDPRVLTVGTMAGLWFGEATSAGPALRAYKVLDAVLLNLFPAVTSIGTTADPAGANSMAGRCSSDPFAIIGYGDVPGVAARFVDDLGLINAFPVTDSLPANQEADPGALAMDRTGRILVGFGRDSSDGGAHVILRRFLEDGTLGDEWTAVAYTGTGPVSDIEVSADSKTAWYCYGGASDTALRRKVKAFDLVNGVALTDFVDVGAGKAVKSITLSPDGTNLYVGCEVTPFDGSVAGVVLRYNMAAALQQTYTMPVTALAVPAPLTVGDNDFYVLGSNARIYTVSILTGASTSFASTGTSGLLYRPGISCTPVSVGCPTPTTGSVGVVYTGAVAATGGVAPYVYSISAGALPTGLTLNASTGGITGTPSVTGSFHFTVRVVDAVDDVDTTDCLMGIGVPPSPTIEFPMRRVRRTPYLSSQQLWTFFAFFQLDLEAGLGPTDQSFDPQVGLSWSDDGGHTWHGPLWMSAGKSGEYKRRVFWLQLGRSRARVWQLETSDPYAVRWLAAYMNVNLGTA